MLILVGVTINFALNGGLINKAKQASSQMQIEADREALLSCVIASIGLDGKVDFATLNTEVQKIGFTGSNGTYTSKAGNTFTVDENGTITYTGGGNGGSQATEDPDLTYLKSLIGQKIGDVIADMSGPIFSDPNIEIDQAALENMSSDDFIDNGDGTYTINYPILYKNKPYSMTMRFDPNDQTNSTILDIRTRTGSSGTLSSSSSSDNSSSNNIQTHEAIIEAGKYVAYGGLNYIIMTEDSINGTVDLISANALKVNNSNIALGYNDPGAISAVPAVDENNPTTTENAERAIWSYNNVVETLVTACKNATGLTVDGTNVISIRSVGNTNVKYTSSGITGSDNPGTYIYDWQLNNADSDWYTEQGYTSYNIKDANNDYLTDWNAMTDLGIARADNVRTYWIVSRYIGGEADQIHFNIVNVKSSGDSLFGNNIFYLRKSNGAFGLNIEHAVRPIVTINTDLLNSVTGSGESYDPYVIQ